MPIGLRRPSKDSDKLFWRDGDVRLLDRAGDRVPVEPFVELHADPAAVADVRRDKVMLRVGLHETALHPGRRRAPQRETTVRMVVVHVGHERLLTDEPRRRAVTRALARLGKRKTDLADAPERVGAGAEARGHIGQTTRTT